jgi:hypothetical protein
LAALTNFGPLGRILPDGKSLGFRPLLQTFQVAVQPVRQMVEQLIDAGLPGSTSTAAAMPITDVNWRRSFVT